jgi:hypothetical protein
VKRGFSESVSRTSLPPCLSLCYRSYIRDPVRSAKTSGKTLAILRIVMKIRRTPSHGFVITLKDLPSCPNKMQTHAWHILAGLCWPVIGFLFLAWDFSTVSHIESTVCRHTRPPLIPLGNDPRDHNGLSLPFLPTKLDGYLPLFGSSFPFSASECMALAWSFSLQPSHALGCI